MVRALLRCQGNPGLFAASGDSRRLLLGDAGHGKPLGFDAEAKALEGKAGVGRIVDRALVVKLDGAEGVEHSIAPVLFPVGELDLRGTLVEGFEQRGYRCRTGNLDRR